MSQDQLIIAGETPNWSSTAHGAGMVPSVQVADPAHDASSPSALMFASQSPGGNHATYEEFFSDSVPCPSCRGLGRIPKDQEKCLVALIPLDDNRLKPRRTALYVCIAVGICLLIGGSLLFFLLPRPIGMSASYDRIIPSYSYVNTTDRVVMLTVVNSYNFSNQNYFSVSINSLEVTALFDTKVLGQAKNTTQVSIPLRTTRLHQTTTNITFDGDEGYIAEYCAKNSLFSHTLLMPFEALASVTYLGHSEQISLTTYQHVQCSAKKHAVLAEVILKQY